MPDIMVNNLAWDTSEETLRNTFGQFGKVARAKIIQDRYTGRSLGYALVTMRTADATEAAITAMHGAELEGRELRVGISSPRTPKGKT